MTHIYVITQQIYSIKIFKANYNVQIKEEYESINRHFLVFQISIFSIKLERKNKFFNFSNCRNGKE